MTRSWTRIVTKAKTATQSRNEQVGGLLYNSRDWGRHIPRWQIIFEVDDCDAGISRTTALGGSVVFAPLDVAKAGRLAILADPEDAIFVIISRGSPRVLSGSSS